MGFRIPEGVTTAIAAGLIGLAGVIVGQAMTFFAKDRELDVRMLEIALGILREDPAKSQITAARGWAVDVINESSPVPINEKVRQELIKSRFPFTAHKLKLGGWNSYYDDYYKFIPNAREPKPSPAPKPR